MRIYCSVVFFCWHTGFPGEAVINIHLQNLENYYSSTLPSFKQIERSLEEIPPALLSEKIIEDAGFAFLTDYYLKVIDDQVAKKIIQNPFFTFEALTELFNWQITHVYKAHILKKEPPPVLTAYWKHLSRSHYGILLKNLIERSSGIAGMDTIIQKVDLVHLKMISSGNRETSRKILDLFKTIGNDIHRLISRDFNIYNYAFELATEYSDDEFIGFLEEYSNLFVQMRIASMTMDEIANRFKDRKPDDNELLKIIVEVPGDSLKLTLTLMTEKGWLSENESENIEKYINNLKS